MGNIHFRAAIVFGVPSIISVFVTRAFIVPAIPATIIQIGDWTLTKSLALLLFFAATMLIASFSMIVTKKKETIEDQAITFNYALI